MMKLPHALLDAPFVFLTGAGASLPLGLPSTVPFLREARKALLDGRIPVTSDEFARFANDRLSADTDIEVVLGQLEEQSEWATALLNDSVAMRDLFSGDPTPLSTFRAHCDQLRESIYRMVIETYGNVDRQRAIDLYRGLLGHYLEFFRHQCGGRETVPFFTLNYDVSIERACAGLGIRCVDGIESVPRELERVWSPAAYADYEETGVQDAVSVVLVKLHGSVRLAERRSADGEVAFVEVPAGSQRGSSSWPHVVLYPTLRPKPVTTEPFRTAYRMLQACLTSNNTYCLVVIGCSFRDPELNDLIKTATEDNEHLHILVVDPALDHRYVARQIACPEERVAVIQRPFAPEDINALGRGEGQVLTPLRLWIAAALGEQFTGRQFGFTEQIRTSSG